MRDAAGAELRGGEGHNGRRDSCGRSSNDLLLIQEGEDGEDLDGLPPLLGLRRELPAMADAEDGWRLWWSAGGVASFGEEGGWG